MELEKATLNFANALTELIQSCVADATQNRKRTSTEKTDTSVVYEDLETPEKEEVAFPENFLEFLQMLPVSDRKSALVSALNKCVCEQWDTARIIFKPMDKSAQLGAKDIEELKALLKAEIGFTGALCCLDFIDTDSVVNRKPGRPKKDKSVEDTEITPDELKRECVKLAQKLGDREKVLGVLQLFGATRIDDLPKEKYPAILNAIKNYEETTTATMGSKSEF